ncbi:MAG: choice-of-anchor J domain-containing protein [Lachnospiraceae bacterium]|nr:choice-of-anchor J domain-containing protein [Lachnospiraceae bacterium]
MRGLTKRFLIFMIAFIMVFGMMKMSSMAAGSSVDGYTVFYENFDHDGAAPAGWTFRDGDGDGNQWYVLDRPTAPSGNYVMTSASYINDEGALTPDNWMFTPAIKIPVSSVLSFWMGGQDVTYYAEHMRVYIGTSTSSMSVLSGELVSTPDFVEYTCDLSAYAGKTVYIGFRHYNVTNQFMINLDDVRIIRTYTSSDYIVTVANNIAHGSVTASPDYGRPGDTITLNIQPDLAYELDELIVKSGNTTVSVTQTDGAYVFQMPVGNVNINATFAQTAVISLFENFEHNGALPTGWRFIDGDGDGNQWYALDDVDADIHSGEYALTSESYINEHGALTPDNWAITPAITVGQGTKLSFWMNGQDANFVKEKMQVYVGTSPSVNAMTPLSEKLIATAEYQRYIYDLSAYAGRTVYFGFRLFDVTDMFWFNLEDVAVYTPTGNVVNDPVIMNYVKAAFDGKLGLCFFVAIPDWLKNQPNAYVTLTQAGVTKTKTIADVVATGVNSDGLYRIATYMPAAYYREAVVMRFYDNNGELVSIKGTSGADLTNTGVTYTLQRYAAHLLTNGSTSEKSLARAMNDYGTAAQIYFDHPTEGETLTLSTAIKLVNQSQLSGYTSVRGGELTSKIKGFHLTASFEADNTLKLGIVFAGNGMKAKNMKYYISEDGTFEHAVETTLRGSMANGYYLSMKSIPAAYLDKNYTFFMVDQDTNQSYYITCSVFTYIKATAFNQDFDEDFQNLTKALFLYGKAAKSYFGVH